MAAVDFNALALAPCISVFGDAATYVPGGGAPVAITGIFNRAAIEEKLDATTGLTRQARLPTFALNIKGLPPGMPLPCKSHMLIIGGESWEITEPVLDHFGHLLLKLKKLST